MLIDFRELFKRWDYKPKGIVHCGASTGQERDVYAEFGIPVIWIEAIPEVYEQLKINLKDYPNQDSVLACLSDEEDKEVTFHVSNNEAQSSSFLELGTHKESHPTVSYLYDFATKTKTLKSVISETGVDVTDWLLVGDLQGAEGLMLKGAGDLLNKFSGCYLEVNTNHVYENCIIKPEIESHLAQYGFVPREEFIYHQWFWGDQFFTKETNS